MSRDDGQIFILIALVIAVAILMIALPGVPRLSTATSTDDAQLGAEVEKFLETASVGTPARFNQTLDQAGAWLGRPELDITTTGFACNGGHYQYNLQIQTNRLAWAIQFQALAQAC